MSDKTQSSKPKQEKAKLPSRMAEAAVNGEFQDVVSAFYSAARGRPLNPDDVMMLQRTAGNRSVQRMLSLNGAGRPTVMRQQDGQTLTQALGFDTQFEDPSRIVARSHPIISNIVALTRQLLVAQFVDHDRGQVRTIYTQIHRLYGEIRDMLDRIGNQAPHQMLWSQERMALGMIMDAAESGPRYARLGSYTRGRERHSLHHLIRLNRRLVRVMSPTAGRAARRLPGGSFERKIYLGSVPGPGFIANFYLILKITAQGTGSGGPTTGTVGASADEEGAVSPSLGTTTQTPGGGELSAEVTGGGGGPTGQVGVQGQGPGGSTTQAQLDTSGQATGTITVPAGNQFSQQVQITSDGNLTYQIRHSRMGGLSLQGSINSVSLTAMAPEIRMGNVTLEPKIKVEIVPNARFWPATATQRQSVIRFTQIYAASVAAIFLVPIIAAGAVEAGAAGVAAAGGAEAMPIVIQVGRALGQFVLVGAPAM